MYPFLINFFVCITLVCYLWLEVCDKMESTGFNMDRSFVTEVDENKIPKVGMYFNILEEAYTIYNGYAKVARISVRKRLG